MAQGFYGGVAQGLLAGVSAGLPLGRAYRQGRDAKRNTAMLNLEADLAGAEPPPLPNTQGALSLDTGQEDGEDTDGRTGLAQGYAGNNVKTMWDNVRRAAAELGDPLAYADSEGRVLDILTKKFKAHMMSGSNLLTSDPAAAVEEFAKASYWIPDGAVPTFNVITTPDGSTVVAHRATDPETGKEKLTMLTPDMIQSIILTQESAEQMVAGISGIRAEASARYVAEVEREVTAYTGAATFLKDTQTSLESAFDEITPDKGKITRTVTEFTDTGEVKTEEKVPAFAQDRRNLADARVAAKGIVLANIIQPKHELMRGGAIPTSSISGIEARDMVGKLIDGMIAGNAPLTGFTKINEVNGMTTFRYLNSTVNIPSSLLQSLARIANRVREKQGYNPLPSFADEQSSEEIPSGTSSAPAPAPAPAAGIPTDVDPSVMGP